MQSSLPWKGTPVNVGGENELEICYCPTYIGSGDRGVPKGITEGASATEVQVDREHDLGYLLLSLPVQVLVCAYVRESERT